jgi:hypothetical protein
LLAEIAQTAQFLPFIRRCIFVRVILADVGEHAAKSTRLNRQEAKNTKSFTREKVKI